MAYRCDICGKGVLVGRYVSHSRQRTRKLSLPNLHSFRGILNGKKGKWKLCTKCLRKVKKLIKADVKADESKEADISRIE